jgi:PHS family inorganic phosphate transporter-like MFS transporter
MVPHRLELGLPFGEPDLVAHSAACRHSNGTPMPRAAVTSSPASGASSSPLGDVALHDEALGEFLVPSVVTSDGRNGDAEPLSLSAGGGSSSSKPTTTTRMSIHAASSPSNRASYSALMEHPAADSSEVHHPQSDPAASPSNHAASSSRFVRFTTHPLFKILVAGAGFTADAYDLFIMNLVLVLLKYTYDNESDSDSSILADAVLAGSVIGQLLFGILADRLGRRKGFIATLSLLTVGATLSACSFSLGSVGVFGMLAFWRFILGVGIGGEYPLAATVSSESAGDVVEGRGRRVAGVFSMQGIGSILAPLVVLSLLGMSGPGHTQVVWRLSLAIGALPGIGMIYFRLQMKESKVFEKAQLEAAELLSAANDAASSSSDLDPPRRSTFLHRLSLLLCSGFSIFRPSYWRTSGHGAVFRMYWREFAGTAGSWFIVDVIFYGQGLFSSQVLGRWYSQPHREDAEEVHAYLIEVATSTLILGLLALPGYWCAVAFIDILGRKKLQMVGFLGMTLMYSLCGALLPVLTEARTVFFLLYGLTFFCINFGPNTTTFVIPSEAFPTKYRATLHGASAAAGKLGAVLGGAIMPTMLPEEGSTSEEGEAALARVMYLCAGLSAFGAGWTWWFTQETRFRQLGGGAVKSSGTHAGENGSFDAEASPRDEEADTAEGMNVHASSSRSGSMSKDNAAAVDDVLANLASIGGDETLDSKSDLQYSPMI